MLMIHRLSCDFRAVGQCRACSVWQEQPVDRLQSVVDPRTVVRPWNRFSDRRLAKAEYRGGHCQAVSKCSSAQSGGSLGHSEAPDPGRLPLTFRGQRILCRQSPGSDYAFLAGSGHGSLTDRPPVRIRCFRRRRFSVARFLARASDLRQGSKDPSGPARGSGPDGDLHRSRPRYWTRPSCESPTN